MDKPMEIDEIRVDPSPFQLVERTSLHKVGGQRVCVNRSLFETTLLSTRWWMLYIKNVINVWRKTRFKLLCLPEHHISCSWYSVIVQYKSFSYLIVRLRSILEFLFKEENKVAGAKYEQRLSRFSFHCTLSESSVGDSSGTFCSHLDVYVIAHNPATVLLT